MVRPDDEARLLLSGTAPVGRPDWLRVAAAVVRRSGRMDQHDPDDRVLEVLGRTDFEGLPIPAIGDTAATSGLTEATAPGQAPFLRGGAASTGAGWDVRSYIADPDPKAAAATALEDLDGGVSSLWLRVGGNGTKPGHLDKVLRKVYLDLAPVMCYPAGDTTDIEVTSALRGIVTRRELTLHPDSNIGADPAGRLVRLSQQTPQPVDLEKPLWRISHAARDLGIRGFVVDGTVAHERGAGPAAELGWSLAVGATYLRVLSEIPGGIDYALRLIEFRYAATDDQFATIAKFRAARLLWDRVAHLSGASADRTGQMQQAVTSRPMMTKYDPWTNLLRTTIAAFAAGVGGARSITVMPFDSTLGVPDPLGRRLARNISHLLIGESHVTAAADPAGGSYAVEALTAQLADAAWAEFQRIEASGSVLQALYDGSLVRRWAEGAAHREDLVATRRQPITGLSEFPLAHERLPSRKKVELDIDGDQFYSPWAQAFESMRDLPVPGSVFLATVGPVAAHSGRAAFVTNAFAAGGIDAVGGDVTGSVKEVLTGYRSAGTPEVVCLAGSDRGYAESGKDLIYALRAVGAERILLAGKPSTELAGLVDDHLAVGEDVVEFLLRTRHAMGFPDKPTNDGEPS
ncbi:methylmalonyl-CoA mutase [Nakamurella sp. UYEF19]|uniref:methylmalonyl-CoA mutase family protein n=1 Tax=Nakamurella sp. UYEF19 TaxID=1756392 RepID=UPI003395F02F